MLRRCVVSTETTYLGIIGGLKVPGGGVGEEDLTAEIVTVVPAGLVCVGLSYYHRLKGLQSGGLEMC